MKKTGIRGGLGPEASMLTVEHSIRNSYRENIPFTQWMHCEILF
jgi:hypothetical protein